MTVRTAHAGSVARPASSAFAFAQPTWLDRIGIAPAANDPAGPCLYVAVERGPRAEASRSRRAGLCTTTLVSGSRLDIIA